MTTCRAEVIPELAEPDARWTSPGCEEPDGVLSLEEMEQDREGATAFALEIRVAGKDEPGVVAGGLEKSGCHVLIGQAKPRQAALSGAEQFSSSSQSQVLLGNLETVIAVSEDIEPSAR